MIKKFNTKSKLLTAVGFIAILGVSAFSLVDVKAETTEAQKQEIADRMKKEELAKQNATDNVTDTEADKQMAAATEEKKKQMAQENAKK